jgi:CheY-like chemotaxis protein
MNRPESVTILVADYDRWRRQSVCGMLSESGFAVLEASNGPSALRQAMAASPHIVVLGEGLPEISTADVAQTLGDDPRTRHSAVVQFGRARPPANPIDVLATVVEAYAAAPKRAVNAS